MLEMKDVSVSFGKENILTAINLQVRDSEFMSLLGPSGCGKSTLLKTICGFVRQEMGEVIVNGENIDKKPLHQRKIVLVFQDLRLFPHMRVWENVAFPLKMKGMPRQERKRKACDLLSRVNLQGLEFHKIGELSGGQQQRVALARAFAAKPDILLLDEPFSGLDEVLKEEMHELLLELHKSERMSIIFVTHDKQEALMLSDRIAVMEHGRILQIGSPRELYSCPNSLQVAKYFADRNFIMGTVEDGRFQASWLSLICGKADGKAVASIPYYAIHITDGGIPCIITRIDYAGRNMKVTVEKEGLRLVLLTSPSEDFEVGSTMKIMLEDQQVNYY